MRRIALVVAYLAAMIVAIVLFNANTRNQTVAMGIWGLASVALGLRTRTTWLGLVAFVAIPLAVPFGSSNQSAGGDVTPVWSFALVGGILAAIAVALSAFSARAIERWRARSTGRSHRGNREGE